MDQKKLFKKQTTALGILWFLGLLSVLGCSKDIVDKTFSSEASVFEIGRVVAYSTLPTIKKGWSDFKTGNYIDLVACLKNKGINAPLLNDTFSVSTPNGRFLAKSDENGCIRWGDYHAFHFIGQEHYRSYNIIIEGIGRHKGRYSIPLAVNPWKDNAQAVKDLRFDQLAPKYLISKTHNKNPVPIHVKDIKVAYEEGYLKDLETYSVVYNVSLWPTFKRFGLDQNIIETPFKEGFFNLEFILLEKTPKNSEYFQIAKTKKNISIQNSFLNTAITFNIKPNNWPKATSLLKVLVKISPIGSAPRLEPFQGMITMNDMLKNNHSTPIRIISEFSDHIISRTGFTQTHRDDFVFEIDEVSAQYGVLVDKNYNKKPNKILRSKIKIRLSGALQKEILRNTNFSVTVINEDGQEDGSKRIVEVDSKGNLETYALIHYNVYNCEHWFPLKIKIEAVSGQFKGLKKERTIAVNPWNKTDFFYDIKRQGPPPQSSCILPKVHIAKVKYINQEIDQNNFYLDRYLNLSIRKFYRIIFQPQLKIFSSHLQETTLAPIMYGNFTLRWDLYTPKKSQVDYQNIHFDDFTYITSAEKDISVKDGIVDERIALPFYIEETISLSYKNLVVLTLVPKDGPYLQPATRHFAFYAKDAHRERETRELTNYRLKPKDLKVLNHIRLTGFKIPPGFNNEELPSSIELYKQYLQNTRDERTETMFITPDELTYLLKDTSHDFYDPEYPEITKLDYNRLFFGDSPLPSSILKKICPFFYSPTQNKDLLDCFESPHKHIDRIPMTHILDIVDRKKVTNINGRVLNIPHATFIKDQKSTIRLGKRFSVSLGSRSSEGMGKKSSFGHYEGYSWGLNIPVSLYFNIGGSYSKDNELFKRNISSQMSTVFSFNYADIKQLALSLNAIKLRFNAKVVSCFSIFPKRPSVSVRAHVCQKERYAKVEEEWFFVADLAKENNQIISDPARIGDSDGPMLIRSRFNFNRFWNKIQRKSISSTKNFLSDIDQNNAIKKHLSLLDRKKISIFTGDAIQEYNFFPGLSVLTHSYSRGRP